MAQMECNVGGADRIARVGIGAVLIGVGIGARLGVPFRIAAGTLGAIGVATGLLRYCPISKAFNVNTCSHMET